MSLQHMLLKIRKTILKFKFIPSIMSIVLASFKLPISTKMPVTILQNVCLHGSYSSKFEFFFANLVGAWW